MLHDRGHGGGGRGDADQGEVHGLGLGLAPAGRRPTPITAAALGEPSGEPAWRAIPSYFLIPTGDKNIPPAAQRFMAQRAHGSIVTIRNASHAVLVSQPNGTARLIERAANDAS